MTPDQAVEIIRLLNSGGTQLVIITALIGIIIVGVFHK